MDHFWRDNFLSFNLLNRLKTSLSKSWFVKTVLKVVLPSFLLLPAFYAEASTTFIPFTITEPVNGVPFGQYMHIMEDPQDIVTINDLTTGRLADQLKVYPSVTPKFGVSQSTFWAKFLLNNPSSSPRDIFLECRYANGDYMDLYEMHGDGSFKKTSIGDKLKFSDREQKYRYPVWHIVLPAGVTTYYMRLKNAGASQMPLYLWSSDTFHDYALVEYVYLGAIFGAMIALFIYNIFLLVFYRTKAYSFYVLWILSYLLFSAAKTGLWLELIRPNVMRDWFENEGLPISIDVCSFIALSFSIHFLHIDKKNNRKSLMLINALRLLALSNIPHSLFFNFILAEKLTLATNLSASVVLLTIGVRFVIKGYRPAIYYTIGWTIFLLGNLLSLGVTIDLLPENILTTWAALTGSVIELLVMSLALGDLMNLIRRERAQAIEARHEAERQRDAADRDKQAMQKELITMQQSHIKDLDKEVEEKTRDIKSILKNIKLGIFTILPKQKIGNDYSPHLCEIIGKCEVEGHNLAPLILEQSDLTSDEISQISSALDAAIGEPGYIFDVNKHHLKSEFRLINHNVDHQKSEKIVEMAWDPILGENDRIEKILVTMRDATDMRKLQDQADMQRTELTYIEEILANPPDRFADFVKVSRDFLDENERLINASKDLDKEILKILFINMHTMKGTARGLALRGLTELMHNTEKLYAKILNYEIEWNQELLSSDLRQIRNILDTYTKICEEKLGRALSQGQGCYLDNRTIELNIFSLQKLNTAELNQRDRRIIEFARETFHKVFYIDGSDIFNEIFANIPRISRDLNKDVPKIIIHDGGYRFSKEAQEMLKNSFVHIIRNSMDHGIETPHERLKHGKAPAGTIYLNIEECHDELHVIYKDDGRGLNLKVLAEHGLRLGILDQGKPITRNDIAQLIYVSGLSTSTTISHISGRGVGMAAVKSFLTNKGCSINIVLQENGADADWASFEYVIKIPSKYYLGPPNFSNDTGFNDHHVA